MCPDQSMDLEELELHEIVLASQSQARQQILQRYRIPFRCMPTHVDESQWMSRDPCKRAADRAFGKAHKALAMLTQQGSHQGILVIAADQTMAVGGVVYGKARSRAEAYQRLSMMSGQKQYLYSALVIAYVKEGVSGVLATDTKVSVLSMKSLTARDIENYLDLNEWQGSVGCVRIEGAGEFLFSHIEGDHDSIQGLQIKKLFAWVESWDSRQSLLLPDYQSPLLLPLKLTIKQSMEHGD